MLLPYNPNFDDFLYRHGLDISFDTEKNPNFAIVCRNEKDLSSVKNLVRAITDISNGSIIPRKIGRIKIALSRKYFEIEYGATYSKKQYFKICSLLPSLKKTLPV